MNCFGKVGLNRNRFLITRDRLVQLSGLCQIVAELIVRLGIIRLEFQRSPVAVDSSRDLPFFAPRNTKVVMRRSIVRSEAQRPLVGSDRLIELAAPLLNDPQIAVKRRIPRRGRDGLPDQNLRVFKPTNLAGDQAKPMQRFRISRLNLQHLPVNRFGLFEAASAVVRGRRLHQTRDCQWVWHHVRHIDR